ncbi:DUF5444 family protein [Pantoea sp. MBD-2R]|uniref:DUF5444 family protein n=1 Tax=Pantoea sp. MBD-2R TaxID=3141540 RepID=UPI003183706F
MTIVPVAGTIYVTQGNTEFKKVYEESFPDTKEGMKKAFDWATTIALGWHDCQDSDWDKHHAA